MPAAKTKAVTKAAASPPALQSFTFGDPEPVLNSRTLLAMDHMECWRNGKWYEPPISYSGLSRTRHASPHHGSAIQIKINLLKKLFIPSPMLSRAQLEAMALDYLVLGNAYPEKVVALSGRPLRVERAMAKYTRVGVDPGKFFYLSIGQYGGVYQEHEFAKGAVLQLKEADIDQEVYGMPQYLSALQSIWLNEAATIFRRRYYQNGSHAGYILYMTDAAQAQDDIDALRQALKDSKGPGNFRNVFLYAPGGKKDGVQLIPVSEVAAKDEFLGIKGTSRDDVLAAHRVPPQLLGIVPANAGGFGDVGKANDVFFSNEIEPLQQKFDEINEWLGEEAVKWRPYEPMSKGAAPANDNGR